MTDAKLNILEARLPDAPYRLAVALSGSGLRWPFHVGALQCLRAHGYKAGTEKGPDVLAGISGGALVAPMFCQGEAHWQHLLDKMNALRSADQYYTGSPLFRLLRKKRSLYSDRAFRAEVWGHLPSGEPVIQTPFEVPCIVGTVNENGHFEVFTDRDHSETFRRAMMGSSKVSPFYPPEEIGDSLYLDGGYRHFLGDLLAIGADRIIIVSTEPLRESTMPDVEEGILPALDHAMRGISILHREVVRGDIDTFDAINDLIPEGQAAATGRSGKRYRHVLSERVYPKHSRSGRVITPELARADFEEGFAAMEQVIQESDWLEV